MVKATPLGALSLTSRAAREFESVTALAVAVGSACVCTSSGVVEILANQLQLHVNYELRDLGASSMLNRFSYARRLMAWKCRRKLG